MLSLPAIIFETVDDAVPDVAADNADDAVPAVAADVAVGVDFDDGKVSTADFGFSPKP